MNSPTPGFGDRLQLSIRGHRGLWEAIGFAVVGSVLSMIGLTRLWDVFVVVDPATIELWWFVVLVAAGSSLMLVKRRWPLLTLAVGAALFAIDTSLGGSIGVLLIFVELLYNAVSLSGPRARRRILMLIFAVLVAGAVMTMLVTGDYRSSVAVTIQLFTLLGLPYWWAEGVRAQREIAQLERRRADDAQRHAEQRRDEAILEVRSEMARELHDAVAGDISAIAIHSEAALARADGDGDRPALRVIRSTSVRALGEMRSMIDLLRAPDGGDYSRSGVAQAGEYVSVARRAGVDVAFDAAQLTALPQLPPMVDHAAARIVQEALTNIVKHAPGSRADVTVRCSGGDLQVEVTSRSRGAASAAMPAPAATGLGLGLVTMRERAEALGGVVDAGPIDDHEAGGEGWFVHARIPVALS